MVTSVNLKAEFTRFEFMFIFQCVSSKLHRDNCGLSRPFIDDHVTDRPIC